MKNTAIHLWLDALLALQALPITFGHKTAIWLTELARHYQRLKEVEPRLFVGSVVGAVGTQSFLAIKLMN